MIRAFRSDEGGKISCEHSHVNLHSYPELQHEYPKIFATFISSR